MANFTEECAEAMDRAAKTVGAYCGWTEKMVEKLNEDIDGSPLGFWKRRAVRGAVRKMAKELKKQEREFTRLVEELGKLASHLNEEDFIEKCESVRRLVTPLFAKTRLYYGEVDKIIAIAKFTTKKEA